MKICKRGHLFESRGRGCTTCNVLRATIWNNANKRRHYSSCKKWARKNSVKLNAKAREWKKNNPDVVRSNWADWYPKNKTRIRAYRRARLKNNPVAAIAKRMRDRLTKALIRHKTTKKRLSLHAEPLMGCTWEELINHLESLFLPGMTWDNRHLWHVDHIKPIASFDLTDISQLKSAFHYKNTRPLWRFDNQSKGRRIIT